MLPPSTISRILIESRLRQPRARRPRFCGSRGHRIYVSLIGQSEEMERAGAEDESQDHCYPERRKNLGPLERNDEKLPGVIGESFGSEESQALGAIWKREIEEAMMSQGVVKIADEERRISGHSLAQQSVEALVLPGASPSGGFHSVRDIELRDEIYFLSYDLHYLELYTQSFDRGSASSVVDVVLGRSIETPHRRSGDRWNVLKDRHPQRLFSEVPRLREKVIQAVTKPATVPGVQITGGDDAVHPHRIIDRLQIHSLARRTIARSSPRSAEPTNEHDVRYSVPDVLETLVEESPVVVHQE